MKLGKKALAGIQYVGLAGITGECKNGVMRLLQFGDRISRVRILSCVRTHCLLLTDEYGEVVAVKSGFSSGYMGEGPHGLSFVLQVLEAHEVEIDEIEVSEEVIERVDQAALTNRDLESIDSARAIQPSRWHDYIFDRDLETNGALWLEFRPMLPYGIIDNRIMDLVLGFEERPDHCLLTGYRRLEDIMRKRTGIAEHGVKLFSQAFDPNTGKLTWEGLCEAEQKGRSLMFVAAYMAYRNPRAHRELSPSRIEQVREFLALNNLYVLERQACERVTISPKDPPQKPVKAGSKSHHSTARAVA